jgi:hypothetical protein
MVDAEPADAVSRPDTEFGQPVREAAHPVRELAIGTVSPWISAG